MSLRRYLFEWYTDNGANEARHLLRAADAKDAMVIFEKTALSGVLLGFSGSYRMHAVADDACPDCYGTGRVNYKGGHFNILCGPCKGTGTKP